MYLANRVSSGFHLAVMAREELGRANLLWKWSSEMEETDMVEAKDIIDKLKDHKAKLDAGQSTTHVKFSPEMMAKWALALRENDRKVLDSIHQKRKQMVAQVRKHDPGSLHNRRLRAQYVQLKEDGTWSRPSETKRKETHDLIFTVAVEISGTLLEAEADERIKAISARTLQALPTYADFETRVVRHLLSEYAQPTVPPDR